MDTSDTEIDAVVTIDYDKRLEPDKDYPYYDKFQKAFLSKVDIAYLNPDSCVVADYSKLITDNIELFKKFVKEHWVEESQYVLEDMTELQYQFIKEFHLLLAGYGTETDNRNYYELISECVG
jgi:hypothetical protein